MYAKKVHTRMPFSPVFELTQASDARCSKKICKSEQQTNNRNIRH